MREASQLNAAEVEPSTGASRPSSLTRLFNAARRSYDFEAGVHQRPVGLQVATIALAIVFSVSTFMRSPGYNIALDGVLYTVFSFAAAGLCVERWRRGKDTERRAWLLLGIGLALWSCGGLAWAIELALSDEPPQPSIADLGWLASYGFLYAGVLTLTRARIRAVPRSVWFDGLIGGLSAASLGAAIAFEPIASEATGDALTVVVNLAYPLADLMLLGLVVCSFALTGWRPDRSLLLMGGGLLLFAVSDSGYLLAATKGVVPEGTPLDIPWTIGLVMMAMAPWQHIKHSATRAFEQWTVIAVPMVFVCIALGVLAVDRFMRVPVLAVLLALSAIGVGMARLMLTFKEVRTLSESRRQARTDDLTELGNRRLFYERSTMLLRKRSASTSLSLLLIDLDRFKEVNDSLGHHQGDVLLRQIGPRLRETIRQHDTISRLGGDEFAVLLDGADREAAIRAAHKVLKSLDIPFDVDGVSVRIGASIGVATFPIDGRDANTLLQHADVAMYNAKRNRSGVQVYEPHTDDHTRERLRSIAELRRAIDGHRLVVHYQPKVDTITGQLRGAEALLRLRHPTRGVLAPMEFLPLAEQASLMKILTAQLLQIVLDDMQRWCQRGIHIEVAVNLSVTNLLDRELPDAIAAMLAQRNIPGRLLTFEITEDTVISDPQRAKEAVIKLRALGAKVSLDDYGTGYTSLAYLRQLPLDELKLDRTFIASLDGDPIAHTFVTTAIQLAHALGLRVVAEGIESKEIWLETVKTGADICQGFLFAHPMSRTQFETLIDRLRMTANSPV